MDISSSLNTIASVGGSEQVDSRISNSASTKRATGRASGDMAPKEVEPEQRKLRIRVFVDEDTGRPGFVVIDEETRETVRAVPSEEVLELAAKMQQMVGLVFSEVV
jgi:uncharacterized FlaG/YvyC family protein